MSVVDRIVDGILDHSRAVIAVMILLTVVVGAGAPMVEQTSSLDQFQTDSEAGEKLEYLEENFQTGDENTTSAQIIIRDDNVLDRESLLGSIAYQQTLRANETVNATLTDSTPTVGISNIVAITAISQEEGEDVQRLATEFQQLNQTVTEERAAIEARNETLTETTGLLRERLTFLRENPDADPAAAFEEVRANTPVEFTEEDGQTFEQAAQQLRQAETQEEAEQAYTLGTQGVLSDQYEQLTERSEDLEATATELESVGDQLQTEREQFQNAQNATLTEQYEQLESMNGSDIESTVATVLGDGGDGGANTRALGFMPTDFDTGSTSAEATMLLVRQSSDAPAGNNAAASDPVIDAQLAMQSLGESADGGEYLIFGAGIISDEINSSMTDSLLIVGPLALIFVIIALVVAYRDVLDILLGLLGIGGVLAWTFGFMGWADISFNQLMIAVPVLLIGLSIDYAIHIFMRHREERGEDDTPRGSMRVALAGVGIALVYVTATTVIGFLSNLTSPIPPIRDFGVVSAFGITAALAIFGILMPAVKAELDEALEARGIDRRKRAFGTGGGRFSAALSVGATAARRAPYLVLVLVLLVSAGGAYGATQVDTSFSQEDFLAEEPADWMKDLPEPFAPGEYTAKSNLEYVNENFIREDSQAQILVEGGVTADTVLERVDTAEEAAADKEVTQTLSNGDPDATTPLSVMRDVAASDEAFAETFESADTDGDGVPDRNVEGVYDALYEAAPDEANSVIYQTDDGEYEALRLVISVQGGASGDAIQTQIGEVATELDGNGLESTATGSAILNKIVQDELLDTVINSLIITLAATFVFLMAAYRLTEGSATLGAVTLLPVALTVTWILGTMYLLDISFNVLTGMITSLTVGLGVAYSIHLSERYNQELARTGDVWDSMERAVTGTGGALLGSAATTIGGFGVLVFAILPPLQQFGLITGMTILYAFLASVLVLPSLLAIWTRFVGPADIDDDSAGDAATTAAAEQTATGDRTGTRDVERTVAAPGDSVPVTVSVTGLGGRSVVHERSDAPVTFHDATPVPVDTATADGSLYVAFETDAATVEYTVEIPADATDGASFDIEGEVLAGDETTTVEGETTIQVIPDLFERITVAGEVSDADLRRAADQYEAGDLSETQMDRIYRAWVRGELAEEQ
ncbi:efflux RND transporter permease subunit [Halosegnis longus]|uniref:Patched family protein n=1 Tax=Halosegnis longus TaxID=2216012 RepID=A0AAJ4UWV3_9EURY|nr:MULTISPECIES: MMPL family transporter [Halobacteriales]RNJ27279.1 Patched family protein [Salella cibi]